MPQAGITNPYSGQHPGIDIAGPYGSAVRSPVNGTVVATRRLRNANGYYSYGIYVIVRDRHGRDHYFAHLSGYNVRVGQTIGQGALLGTVGSTGNSTGNHLHYEVRENGHSINPGRWTPNLGGVLAVASPAVAGASMGTATAMGQDSEDSSESASTTVSGVRMGLYRESEQYELPRTNLVKTKDRITPMFVRLLTDTSREARLTRSLMEPMGEEESIDGA